MNSSRVILGLLCVFGLFAVRYFETVLFYDPLKSFFNGAYQTQGLPQLDLSKWVFGLIGRYCLNTLLSLALLKIIFKTPSVIQFSAMVYGLLLILLLIGVLLSVHYYHPGDYRVLFYLRRFLIHPMLVLLLIPSFLMLNPNKKA